jgi:deoxyribodipyrimidine photo-lyase
MGVTIFWFRRDLRIEDNAGLYHALRSGHKVQCLFIFDKNILSELEPEDARVSFIHKSISQINEKLTEYKSSLLVKFGNPCDVWADLIANEKIFQVYSNQDFEPYALKRDFEVSTLCSKNNIEFFQFKDHVIFDRNEVLKDDGNPYTVFTPYKKKWLQKLESYIEENGEFFYLKSYPIEKYLPNTNKSNHVIPTLIEIGFIENKLHIPDKLVPQSLIGQYDQTRNFPGINGTSKLGIHFRFGTISIREKARKALKLNQIYLSELIWRDFYSQILSHFPQVVHQAFRKEYDNIKWVNNEEDFERWKEGKTGYPIVDAGMRELNQTGYMHNRVRMIVASFLTKHLLIDWRWGEAYFAKKLLDFDLASNNGGWQWAAGCGTDAAPYFRIFSPQEQEKKFDKDRKYIEKWIPEINTSDYPHPIIDHKFARQRCLEVYKAGLAKI